LIRPRSLYGTNRLSSVAYDAVACSPQATARPGSRLSCREVYLAEPESVGEDEPIWDIAYPLGDSHRGGCE
jgi:hypothetical protein